MTDHEPVPPPAVTSGNIGVGSPAPGMEDTPDPVLEAEAAPLRSVDATSTTPNDGPGREESGIQGAGQAPTTGDQPHLPGQTQTPDDHDAQTHR